MLKVTISTPEQLTNFVKTQMSEKRFLHSVGVAKATSLVLENYHLKEETFGSFKSSFFCGLVHDIAREKTDEQLLDYCKNHSIVLSDEQLKSPVITHGIVSADIISEFVGPYPTNWKNAICLHTTGDSNMDNIALALFIADYIEENRTFLNNEKRAFYLSQNNIFSCAYQVLNDMMDHWKTKNLFEPSNSSVRMLEYLKENM